MESEESAGVYKKHGEEGVKRQQLLCEMRCGWKGGLDAGDQRARGSYGVPSMVAVITAFVRTATS